MNEALSPTRLHADAPLTAEEETFLAESGDLDEETRRKVLRLHRIVERADHYEVLGVDRAANRKELKKAYFELAAKLHPDRYFRKRLGSFKGRMEAVFARITLAHDTLGNSKQRAEYDAYLEEKRRSRSIEDLLADALAEVRRAEEIAEKEARDAEAAPSSGPVSGPSPRATPSAPGIPASPKTSAPSMPPVSVDVAASARRDALARRLLGGRARTLSSGSHLAANPSAAAPGVTPDASSRPSTEDAMASLKRRYEERKSLAKTTQARSYVAKGQQALAAGDPISAANSLRVALGLAPEDPEIKRAADEAQAKADEVLAATYEKQAQYEERNGQWTEASRSWARVCRGRPNDAAALDRAANAILKASGDLHEAGRLAQRACQLQPDSVALRLTLANVYLAAGMTLSARRELETAAQRAPHDDTIAAMLKRIGKSA